jgi:sugar lactone lactonase YvrE
MSVMIRTILRVLVVALLGVAVSVPLTSAAQARPFPDRIELPNGFQPEGITIGRHATAYLGSVADGDIYAVSLRTGEYKLISKGLPNSPSVGLKIDNHGRLFLAGGPTGTGRVIDVKTGDIVRNYTFTTEPSFINDVVLTRDYAWFTDSQQPQLYGVPLGRGGTPGGSAASSRCH